MDYVRQLEAEDEAKYGPRCTKCNLYKSWCRCKKYKLINMDYKLINMDIDFLISSVTIWADEKQLLKPENSLKQFTKVVEEVGEVAAALAREDKDELKDGIGDVVVTLIILAEQQGLSLGECLEAAYNEIKNRKGKTINGTFIKESDLG